MLPVALILSGLGVMSISGFSYVWAASNPSAGQRLTVILFVFGSLIGLSGTVLALVQPDSTDLVITWTLPIGQFFVAVDPLSAFFLILIFTIPALGSIYSLSYWKQEEHMADGRKLGLFYGLLAGSMALVVIARDSILFLIAWEIMALAAYFASTTEDDKPEVRQSGWVYLVATHAGTLILISMFALWYHSTGSFSLVETQSIPVKTAGLIFVFAVVGFGFKAGLMPLHVWLPGAHANAPSHVSAVMSGVMLKMGIYGMLRMAGLLGEPEAWWGTLLIAVGSFSGLFAIIFAMSQRDLKRVLAYSSIENIGIITMALGLALLGRACHRTDLILLGMAGGLLHIWNHGLFKPLMFFSSGAIIHASGTRDIELMGGLAKKMPVTALLFLIGAVAISALPPLNGFASEWLIYLGFFKTLVPTDVPNLALAGSAAAILAMTGALVVVTFVKLYGTIFLGTSRSKATAHAHDPSSSMIIPMILLAGLCMAAGLLPVFISPLLQKVVNSWTPGMDQAQTISSLAPQEWISIVAGGATLIAAVLWFWQKFSRNRMMVKKGPTWDCGYGKPAETMQYTGTSFTQPLVNLFSFVLRPKTTSNHQNARFAEPGKFETVVEDTVLEKLILPGFRFSHRILPKIYIFQQGQTHFYVLYILAVTLALFILSGIGGNL